MDNSLDKEYIQWLNAVKKKIQATQIRAALAANGVLIQFYWELGQDISQRQKVSQWGDKVIHRLSGDLRKAFPDLKGLSTTNLKYAKRFYEFYVDEIGQQAVDQFQEGILTRIPWGHNIIIFIKSKDINEAYFYLDQTFQNYWSRDTLALQIKSDLFQRQGKAITNFSRTIPAPDSDLAQQSLKDPYIFDFLTLTKDYKEKDLEEQLVKNITKFLLELGKGFAFIGRQYHLSIADNDYYVDLLFYHITLKCYVVIELKNTKFIPEYAGKMNFYLSAVDTQLKKQDDNATIGILMCRDKNNIEVEFAIRDINKPIGVSEFQFAKVLPDALKPNLPTIEEIEQELGSIEKNNE